MGTFQEAIEGEGEARKGLAGPSVEHGIVNMLPRTIQFPAGPSSPQWKNLLPPVFHICPCCDSTF